MHKIPTALFCCGSRPELIKISPVYHKLARGTEITPLLCVTGQHRDILGPHLAGLDMRPDFELDVMRDGQSLDQLMARLFIQLPGVLDQGHPDIVI
ncbi:MAG: UDP-N-acetyl glucosamine 2-epimerase, partial [Alphaproteobacteria bacterium]|nr:UDP-N-acetyl glucosamine 2-epimerase [Alphaproteobacteria bacterium]